MSLFGVKKEPIPREAPGDCSEGGRPTGSSVAEGGHRGLDRPEKGGIYYSKRITLIAKSDYS